MVIQPSNLKQKLSEFVEPKPPKGIHAGVAWRKDLLSSPKGERFQPSPNGTLKESKRIAMRADKTDQSFEAMINIAAAVINTK